MPPKHTEVKEEAAENFYPDLFHATYIKWKLYSHVNYVNVYVNFQINSIIITYILK